MACVSDRSDGYRILVGRADGKRPLGRSGRIYEDNINMDFQEIGYERKLAGIWRCGNEHSGFIKCGEFLDC